MLISSSSPYQNRPNPKVRILTVGSYAPTLKTWHMLLEAQGYVPISFVLEDGSRDLFNQGPFDVIILGQSIDDDQKRNLVEALRRCSCAPIISIPHRGGKPTDNADIHSEPDPEELLNVIARLVQRQESCVPAEPFKAENPPKQ